MARVNFQNLPSTSTPLNATNMNTIQDETYSTTEQVIGTWTTGKPLYRKVITSTTFSSSYATSIQNIREIVKISGFVYRSDYANLVSPIPSRLENSNYKIDFNYITKTSSGSSIELLWGSSYSSNNVARVQFILEYTKTTD